MTQLNEFYKCEMCGNVVSVVEAAAGELVCCGKPMTLLEEKTAKAEGKEKHVPVMEIDGNKVNITVGSVSHPMAEEHYIELIQLVSKNSVVMEKRLRPGDSPEAEFCCLASTQGLTARALCNIHGLWISE